MKNSEEHSKKKLKGGDSKESSKRTADKEFHSQESHAPVTPPDVYSGEKAYGSNQKPKQNKEGTSSQGISLSEAARTSLNRRLSLINRVRRRGGSAATNGYRNKSLVRGFGLDSGARTSSTDQDGEASGSGKSLRDSGKRQRIFFVAAIVVLFIFSMKVWGRAEWSVVQLILVASGAAVLSYLGLIWAFRFDVTRVGYLTVLPQPALFVFGYVLFVELFFFQRFERIYEAVIFGVVLFIFMMVLGGVFLTANILNVGTVKKLPLLQAAQTASYAITLFNVFLISFFIVNLGVYPILTVVVLYALMFLSVFLHLSNFGLNVKRVLSYSHIIGITGIIVAVPMLFWPIDTMFRVLLPTMVVYVGVGVIMHDIRKALRPLINWEYFLLMCAVLIVILSRAVWGIGGYLWG